MKQKERGEKNTVRPGRRTLWMGSGTFWDMSDHEVIDKVKIQTQLNGGGMVVNEQITWKQSHLWARRLQVDSRPGSFSKPGPTCGPTYIIVMQCPALLFMFSIFLLPQGAINQDWLKDTHTHTTSIWAWLGQGHHDVRWLNWRQILIYIPSEVFPPSKFILLSHISFTFILPPVGGCCASPLTSDTSGTWLGPPEHLPCSSLRWDRDPPPEKKWWKSVHFLHFPQPVCSKRRRKKEYFSNEELRGINVSASRQNCAQQKLYLLWKILIASATFEAFHFKMWGNLGHLPEWGLSRR